MHSQSNHQTPAADGSPSSGRYHKTILSSSVSDVNPLWIGASSHRLVCSHLSAFLVGQNVLVVAFIIVPQGNGHRLLKPFVNIFNGPCILVDEMIFIHDDVCI